MRKTNKIYLRRHFTFRSEIGWWFEWSCSVVEYKVMIAEGVEEMGYEFGRN